MTAKIIPFGDGQGPPATDFEREAVDTLLASIRQFRVDAGHDPEVALTFLGAQQSEAVSRRVTWYFPLRTGLVRWMAYASVLWADTAMGRE